MGAVYGLDCIQDVFICTLHLLQITHPLNTTENQCKKIKSLKFKFVNKNISRQKT